MQQEYQKNIGVTKDEISLKELVYHIREWRNYILSKWKLILVAGLIGGMLGLAYSLLTPAKYKAEAIFVLDNAKGSGGVVSLAAKFGLNTGSGSDGLFSDEDNMVTFLQSRTMVARTLLTEGRFDKKNELLIERYIEFNNLKEKWNDDRLKNLNFRYSQANNRIVDSVVSVIYQRILKQNLSVFKPDKDGNIINVTTTSTDELFSKAFTETLITNAIDFYTKSMTLKSFENVVILQRQTDSIKSLLNNAITGVAVTSEIPNMNPALQRLKVPSQKKVIDVEMNKAILEQLVTNLELAKIELRKETPLIQIIDNPILPLEKKKVGRLKGVVFGGLIAGLAIVLFFSLRLYLRKVMAD